MAMLGYSEMLVAILAFLFIVTLTLWLWWWNGNSLLINWPVVGMIPQLSWNSYRLHDFFTCILQQSQGTFLFKGHWFGDKDFVFTSDPMNIHHILSKNFANYHKGEDFREIFEPMGDGIFISDSDNWRNLRRIFHSVLKSRRFELAAKNTMEQKILNGLFPILKNASMLASEVDIQDVLKRFMFDNICLLVLGLDPNSLSPEFPHIPCAKAYDDMSEAAIYRHTLPGSIWKLQRWLQIGKEKKIRKALDIFDDFAEQCITRKRQQLGQSSRNQEELGDFDLLTYFLVRDDNSKDHQRGEDAICTKSNKFLRDTAFNLLAAGRDTVAAGLAWFFWLVATHPFVEKKILEEMEANLREGTGGKWKIFSIEEVSKLVYLHAVICETLRLYPPVPFEHKASVGPDILPSGHQIPGNMKIIYCLYSMGRMEDIWGKDFLEFKPERWISESGEIKHVPSYKFITFNAGPRTCLGKDLTFLQMKTVASTVLWNFSLQVVENHPIGPSVSLLLFIEKGLKVKVFERFGSSNGENDGNLM
ncbi:alkane hydroxylase MAH1-like [Hevea brasiliensis]|nr:alkane hydroxylase MAH1-like [Hevea brasiliensis]